MFATTSLAEDAVPCADPVLSLGAAQRSLAEYDLSSADEHFVAVEAALSCESPTRPDVLATALLLWGQRERLASNAAAELHYLRGAKRLAPEQAPSDPEALAMWEAIEPATTPMVVDGLPRGWTLRVDGQSWTTGPVGVGAHLLQAGPEGDPTQWGRLEIAPAGSPLVVRIPPIVGVPEGRATFTATIAAGPYTSLRVKVLDGQEVRNNLDQSFGVAVASSFTWTPGSWMRLEGQARFGQWLGAHSGGRSFGQARLSPGLGTDVLWGGLVLAIQDSGVDEFGSPRWQRFLGAHLGVREGRVSAEGALLWQPSATAGDIMLRFSPEKRPLIVSARVRHAGSTYRYEAGVAADDYIIRNTLVGIEVGWEFTE